MEWREFESAAVDLASRAREAFDRHHVGLLATTRRDGSPRISPVEPYFIAGRLVLGLMPWSGKARDLARDPRCELHNPVIDVEGSGPEIRLHGQALPVRRDELNGEDVETWWFSQDEGSFALVSFEITAAASVSWETSRGRLTVERWTPEGGIVRRTRSYP
jgi:hypothetical protein